MGMKALGSCRSAEWKPHGNRSDCTCHATDYIATAADRSILQLEPREPLRPQDVKDVWGYARDLHAHYWVGELLGAGSFGTVREVVEKESGTSYAMKSIAKCPKEEEGPTPRYLMKLQHEVEAMQLLTGSLDCVSLNDVYEDDTHLHVIMGLCTGGSLLDRLKASSLDSEASVANVMRSVMRFISQCHGKGIVFRDIKPENFLFATKDGTVLKATDFGLSVRHNAILDPPLQSRSGTPAYMAPEVIMQKYDHKADVWSAGVMAAQLLTGQFPWGTMDGDHASRSVHDRTSKRPASKKDAWLRARRRIVKVWQKTLHDDLQLDPKKARTSERWKGLSEEALDFLRSCLVRDPEVRPSAVELLSHPWLKGSGQRNDLPLDGTVLQRLQRFATYARLKQLVLNIIAEKMSRSMIAWNQPAGQKLPTVVQVQEGNMPTLGILEGQEGLLEAIRKLFMSLDVDGNGEVTFQELERGLRDLGYQICDMEVKQLMEQVDVDKCGTISFGELAAGLMDWSALADQDTWTEWIDYVFSQLDAGPIGKERRKASQLPPRGVPFRNQAMPAGDCDGIIQLEELMEQMHNWQSPSAPKLVSEADARRALREADADGDGCISREEFANLLLDDASMPDMLTQYDMRLPLNVEDALRVPARSAGSVR